MLPLWPYIILFATKLYTLSGSFSHITCLALYIDTCDRLPLVLWIFLFLCAFQPRAPLAHRLCEYVQFVVVNDFHYSKSSRHCGLTATPYTKAIYIHTRWCKVANKDFSDDKRFTIQDDAPERREVFRRECLYGKTRIVATTSRSAIAITTSYHKHNTTMVSSKSLARIVRCACVW